METTTRVGRNEPCPCGSGKKYKSCCERRVSVVAEAKRTPIRFIALAIVGLGLAGVIALRFLDKDEPEAASTPSGPTAPAEVMTTATTPLPAGPRAAQPPGPVPPGKVWSAEHGHWHDAPGVVSTTASAPVMLDANGNPVASPVSNTPATLTPQPPGEVPAGKVWSPEHGHWHDAPAAGTPATPPH